MNRKGWLIGGTFVDQKSYQAMYDLFIAAAGEYGIDLEVHTTAEYMLGRPFFDREFPDFVIFYDKDIPLAKFFERAGVPIFNIPDAIAACDSKIATVEKLWGAGVSQPETVIGPATRVHYGYKEPRKFMEPIAEFLGYPFVIKQDVGSFGKEVFLVHDETELIDNPPINNAAQFLCQEFIEESAGTDIRICVVGGEVVGSMRRRGPEGDFRSNIGNGGEGLAYEPTDAEKQIAIDATKAMGLDWSGVDVLQGKNGPVICEVNSNPHFMGLYKATGVALPDHQVKYIADVIYGDRKRFC